MNRWSSLLLLLLAGCTKKKAPAVEPPPTPPAVSDPPAALQMAPDSGLRLGLPTGCTLRERPRSAPIAPGTIFFAPDEPGSSLVLVEPGSPPRVGVAPLNGGAPLPLLRGPDGAPGVFAASGDRWLQLVGSAEEPGTLWNFPTGGAPELALRGERVEGVDLRCRGGHCAALSTRAMRVAAGGATVLLGPGSGERKGWERVDYAPEGEGEEERPFVVAGVGQGRATVTMEGGEGVRFLEVEGGQVRDVARLATPHGALDAVVLRRPVVLAHGAPLAGKCAKPRPLLAIQRVGLEAVVVPVDAPPLALFARPVEGGAFAAWLVPTHCGDERRRIVYAALLDEDGGLRSGPMAVAEATGLAVASRGGEVDLWLRQEGRMVWIQARCGEKS